MNVQIEQNENECMAILSGRIDTTNVEQFQHDVEPLMTTTASHIVLDCTEMEYTSSQGLRVILMLQKSATARGAKLVLRHMQPQVREVFDITGFSNIICIE